MKFCLTILMLAVLIPATSNAAVQGHEVEYTTGDTTEPVLKGYLAYDDAIEGPRPGILVVHEWWGHNAYARKRADMLAELGYTALAVDMYGEGREAAHPQDAGRFATEAMQYPAKTRARFMAALEELRQHPTTDPEQTAAIGYCFGGSVVLHMARVGTDLDGVVSFHGGLGSSKPAEAAPIQAQILVCHGAADQLVPEADIAQFKSDMKEAEAALRFIAYPDAPHSFTNPEADAFAEKFGLPVGYQAAADEKSWADMQAFFAEIFAPAE